MVRLLLVRLLFCCPCSLQRHSMPQGTRAMLQLVTPGVQVLSDIDSAPDRAGRPCIGLGLTDFFFFLVGLKASRETLSATGISRCHKRGQQEGSHTHTLTHSHSHSHSVVGWFCSRILTSWTLHSSFHQQSFMWTLMLLACHLSTSAASCHVGCENGVPDGKEDGCWT